MRVLGISAFYHDSAAALVRDGEIVAAAQEERFTRKKHDSRFPHHALDCCLSEAGIGLDQVDLVAFYDKPLLKFERLLETYLAFAPRGFESFKMAIPIWLREKLFLKDLLQDQLQHHRPDSTGTSASYSASITSAMPQAPIFLRPMLLLQFLRWMGSGSGRRVRLLSAVKTGSRLSRKSISRTRWACSTPRSRITSGSRSIQASTN